MEKIKKQNGATLIFWLFFVSLIGFLLMVGVKLFPVYYKGFTTKKIVEEVALDMQKKKPNKKQIWQAVSKRLNINGINGVEKEHFVYAKSGKNELEVGLDYEVRVPIIGNLDAVANFDQRQIVNTK